VVVDPLTPGFEIVCSALIRYRPEGPNAYLVVLWNVHVPYVTSVGIFVAESNVTPFPRDGNISKTVENFHYLTTGERFPHHLSLHELRQLVVLGGVFRLNFHLFAEKLISIVDRLALTVMEFEHFCQLRERLPTSVSTPGQPGFEVSGGHAPVVFVNEFDTIRCFIT